MTTQLTLGTRKFADGPELKAWRARHGLSQPQAALQLGLSEAHVQTIEGGRSPLTKTLRALMAALDRLRDHDGASICSPVSGSTGSRPRRMAT